MYWGLSRQTSRGKLHLKTQLSSYWQGLVFRRRSYTNHHLSHISVYLFNLGQIDWSLLIIIKTLQWRYILGSPGRTLQRGCPWTCNWTLGWGGWPRTTQEDPQQNIKIFFSPLNIYLSIPRLGPEVVGSVGLASEERLKLLRDKQLSRPGKISELKFLVLVLVFYWADWFEH